MFEHQKAIGKIVKRAIFAVAIVSIGAAFAPDIVSN